MRITSIVAMMLTVGLVGILVHQGVATPQAPTVPISVETNGTSGVGMEVVAPDTDTHCYGLELVTDHGEVRMVSNFIWCTGNAPVSSFVGVINQAGSRSGVVWCGGDGHPAPITCSWNIYLEHSGSENIFSQHIRLEADGSWQLVDEPYPGPKYPAFWPQ